jgi:hypothetical protein
MILTLGINKKAKKEIIKLSKEKVVASLMRLRLKVI